MPVINHLAVASHYLDWLGLMALQQITGHFVPVPIILELYRYRFLPIIPIPHIANTCNSR